MPHSCQCLRKPIVALQLLQRRYNQITKVGGSRRCLASWSPIEVLNEMNWLSLRRSRKFFEDKFAFPNTFRAKEVS
jgi:hypothetical protein